MANLILSIVTFGVVVDDLFDLILYVPSTIFQLCRDVVMNQSHYGETGSE